ncbi:MAG: hypothetical protein ACRDRT_17890, partial [Pseudonocardiaceae bacterium]
MKTFTTRKIVLPLLAGALLASTVALSAHAADCKAPDTNSWIEKRACEKANEGPVALRRFIDRTRMIYGLVYAD